MVKYYYYYHQIIIIIIIRIIIGSDRRPETKQGKIVRLRPGRVRDRDSDHRSEPDCRAEAINYGAC